ncbi:MAG: ParB/RepB/Spo0J family partition protein [Deltaproteobacteria bacterium]|nr:ParB/RepB/Spo0J family partition protein [Deltaproteobacteria bacterium]
MSETSKTSIAEQLALEGARRAAPADAPPAPSGAEDDNVLRHILPGQQLLRISVDRLAPAPEGQARQDFDEERLRALAESLRRSGVREPIIVTPHGAEAGQFQIVAGERRWRAAQLAGLAEIPCIVDPGLVERKDKLLAQAEENLHRENLNAVEEAAVLVQLMEERGLDVKEAGELMGKSARQARRMLQLNAAAAPIKRAVARGQLDGRVALEMVRIHNRFAREDESPSGARALKRIERLIERFVGEGWSMRRLETLAAKLEAGKADADESDVAEPRPSDSAPRHRRVTGATGGGVGSSPVPVTERTGDRLVLDAGRIERHELTPEERERLIALLEGLLFQARRS